MPVNLPFVNLNIGVGVTESDIAQVRQYLGLIKREATEALNTGDRTKLDAELTKLVGSTKSLTAALNPLVQASKGYVTQATQMAQAQQRGVASAEQTLRSLKSIEATLEGQIKTLSRGTAEYKALEGALQQVRAQASQVESAARGLSGAFESQNVQKFAQALDNVRLGLQTNQQSSKEAQASLGLLERQMTSYAATLTKGSAEQRELAQVMQAAAAEGKELAQGIEATQRAFVGSQIREFASDLVKVQATGRDADGTFDQMGTSLVQLQGRMREFTQATTLSEAEQRQLTAVMRETQAQSDRLALSQERAQKAYNADQIRAFRTELQTLQNESKNTGASFDQQADKIISLQTRLRDFAGAAKLTASEQASLGKVLQGSEAAFEGLAVAQERASKSLVTSQLRDYRAEMQLLSTSVRGTESDFEGQAAKITALQTKLKDLAGNTSLSAKEQLELARVLQQSESAFEQLALAQQRASNAYDPGPLRQFATELRGIETAQRGTLDAYEKGQQEITQLQSAMREYASTLKAGSAEQADLERALIDTERAASELQQGAERLQQTFNGSEIASFRADLETITAASKQSDADLTSLGAEVETLQARMREFAQSTSLSVTEQRALQGILTQSTTAADRLSTAVQKQVAAMRATEVRAFANELTAAVAAQKQGEQSFEQTAQTLTRLQGEMRDYAQSVSLGAREQADLAKVMQATETAADGLAQSYERQAQALATEQIRAFRTELEQVGTAARGQGADFQTLEARLSALQGSMSQYAGTLSQGSAAQGELSKLMGQTQLAAQGLATQQERLDKAFHAETLRGFNAALLDYKRDVESGALSTDDFRTAVEQLQGEIETLRGGLDRSSQAYVNYTQALTRMDSALAQSEGRMRTFGTQAAFTGAIGDQLQNVLFMFGPAGEAAATAMGAMSTSMVGANLAAKALQITLVALGVGALIALGVALYNVVKGAIALEDAQADVAKTTGLARTEIDRLTDNLQGISRETGNSTTELLGLASVVGSLGVEGVKDITSVTEVINKLALATDVVGEEGAAQLARFINVTKDANETIGESAEKVGNVLNALGNALPATEAEILKTASYMGALSGAADASQVDILALAGTLTSLGIQSELAGGATTRLAIAVQDSANTGGLALQKMASAAGLTSTEFKNLNDSSPVDALLAVAGGMSETLKSGQSLLPVMKSIGITATEERRVMLALVQGYDTLQKARKVANDEARAQESLDRELIARLDTVNGQWGVFVSIIRTAGESLGRSLIPYLREGLKAVNLYVTGLRDFVTGADLGNTRLANFADTVRDWAGDVVTTGVGAAQRLGNEVGPALGRALGNTLSSFDTYIKSTVKSLTGYELSWSGLLGVMGIAAQNTVQFIGTMLARVPMFFQGVIDAGDKLSYGIQEIFGGVGDILSGIGLIVQGFVVEPFIDMYEPIKTAASRVLQTIGNWVNAAGKFFKPFLDTARSMGASIAQFFGVAADTTRDAINTSLDEGVQSFKVKGAELVATSETAAEGVAKISGGFNRAAAGVVAATGSLNDAIDQNNRTLEVGASKTQELTDAQIRAQRASELFASAQGELGTILQADRPTAEAYLSRLEKLGETYPRLKEQLAPLIQQVKDYISVAPGAAEGTDQVTTSMVEGGTEMGKYQQNLLETGRLVMSLQGSLKAQKLKLEFEKTDPTEVIADVAGIAASAAAAAEQAMAQGKPARAQALFDLRDEAQAMLSELLGITENGTGQMSEQWVAAYGDAETAARVWSTQVGTYNDNVTTSVRGATDEQLRALAESYGAYQQNVLATIAAGQSTDDYLESVYGVNVGLEENSLLTKLSTDQYLALAEITADVNQRLSDAEAVFKVTGDAQEYAAERQQIYQDGLIALAQAGIPVAVAGLESYQTGLQGASAELDVVAAAQAAAGDAFNGSALAVQNAGTIYEGVMAGLGQATAAAADEFALTGDAGEFLAQRITNVQTALQLVKGEYASNSVEVQTLTAMLKALTDQQTAQEQSTQAVAESQERGQAATQALDDAMDMLGDASSLTATDFDLMRAAVDNAQGTFVLTKDATGAMGGEFVLTGARADELRAKIDQLESIKQISELFSVFGNMAAEALGKLPGLSDAGKAALGGLAGAATAAGDALADGFQGAPDIFQIVIGAIEGVADALGDEVDPALKTTLDVASQTASGAAAGFAVGGPLGAAIGGAIGLFTGLVDSINAAQEAAIAAAEASERAYDQLASVDDTIAERNLDNLESLNDMALAQGRITEAEHLIVSTQIELARAQADFEQRIADINQERADLIATLDPNSATYEQDVAAINSRYDNLIIAEQNGYELQQQEIIQGGLVAAEALGINSDTFLTALTENTGAVNQAYEGAGLQIFGAVHNFTQAFGGSMIASSDATQDAIDQAGGKNDEAITASSNRNAATLNTSGVMLGTAAVNNGKSVGLGFTTGADLANQGINSASTSQGAALEAYKNDLITATGGIPGQVTPQVVDAHRQLMDAFIQGAQASGGGIDAAEAQQIAAMKAYEQELAAQAGMTGTTVAPGILGAADQIAAAFASGSATTLGGIGTAQASQTAGLESYKAALIDSTGGMAGQVTPQVVEAHRQLTDAFIQGAATSGGGIDQAEAQQIAQMQAYEAQLAAQAAQTTAGADASVLDAHVTLGGAFNEGATTVGSSISAAQGAIVSATDLFAGQISSAVIGSGAKISPVTTSTLTGLGSAWSGAASAYPTAVNASTTLVSQVLASFGTQVSATTLSAFNGVSSTTVQQGVQLSSALRSAGQSTSDAARESLSGLQSTVLTGGQALNQSVTTTYNMLGQGTTSGSSAFRQKLIDAYRAEQASFADQSRALQAQIVSSKGAEQQQLIAQYNALQQKHAAESAAYESAIDQAGRDEQGAIRGAEGLVSAALNQFGGNVSGDTQQAITKIKTMHQTQSAQYEALMRERAAQERAQVLSGATLLSGGYSSATSTLIGAVSGFYSKTGSSIVTQSGTLISTINGRSSAVMGALGDMASAIKNFKFPALPPAPKLPTARGMGDDDQLGMIIDDEPQYEYTGVAAATSEGAYGASSVPLLGGQYYKTVKEKGTNGYYNITVIRYMADEALAAADALKKARPVVTKAVKDHGTAIKTSTQQASDEVKKAAQDFRDSLDLLNPQTILNAIGGAGSSRFEFAKSIASSIESGFTNGVSAAADAIMGGESPLAALQSFITDQYVEGVKAAYLQSPEVKNFASGALSTFTAALARGDTKAAQIAMQKALAQLPTLTAKMQQTFAPLTDTLTALGSATTAAGSGSASEVTSISLEPRALGAATPDWAMRIDAASYRFVEAADTIKSAADSLKATANSAASEARSPSAKLIR